RQPAAIADDQRGGDGPGLAVIGLPDAFCNRPAQPRNGDARTETGLARHFTRHFTRHCRQRPFPEGKTAGGNTFEESAQAIASASSSWVARMSDIEDSCSIRTRISLNQLSGTVTTSRTPSRLSVSSSSDGRCEVFIFFSRAMIEPPRGASDRLRSRSRDRRYTRRLGPRQLRRDCPPTHPHSHRLPYNPMDFLLIWNIDAIYHKIETKT
ncbi:MAG: hypothetical protein O7A66_05265, partial [Alphaproteobacteria bacterium]|nr:hypothetical protein [Alphaproteobacteria bacterium]